MALADWPTTAEVASITTTDAEADSIKSARADINQTIVNVNGLINSFGPLGNITHGQVLKYDSTQDKFLPADDLDTEDILSNNSIGDLGDVDTTGVANGKILKYNSTTSKFEIADDDNTGGGTQNVFSTISVSGESDVVADSNADTLTLVAGSNVTITTDAANDTITIDSTGGGATSPAGSDTEIQYNDSGSFGADQYFAIKNPGGNLNTVLNHRGHYNMGRGADLANITNPADSQFRITHAGEANCFAVSVDTISANSGGYSGSYAGTRMLGSGAIGIYPSTTVSNRDDNVSRLELAHNSDDNLTAKFISRGGVGTTCTIIIDKLPTADPNVAGQLWSNSGVLTVSSG